MATADGRMNNLVLRSANSQDVGFPLDSDEHFNASSDRFKVLIDNYSEQISEWKGGGEPDFATSADRVDDVRIARLDLTKQFQEMPGAIDDDRMRPYLEYFQADQSYLKRSDGLSQEYGSFVKRRALLREALTSGGPVASGTDYIKMCRKVHKLVSNKKEIDSQFEFIDLRKELCQEHFDNPRFIAEVYRADEDMADELLVDLDRRDLLSAATGPTPHRTTALKDVFCDAVRGVNSDVLENNVESENKGETNIIEQFQRAREVGKNTRHNHSSIMMFADEFKGETAADRRNYENGLSAFDNEKFNPSMWNKYVSSLSREEGLFIKEKKGPEASFIVARKRLISQLREGHPDAAKSYAVLQHAAEKIHNNANRYERFTKMGDGADLAALNMFSEENQANLTREVREEVDEAVITKMGSNVITEGERVGSVERASDGDRGAYDLNVSKSTRVTVISGSEVLLSDNEKDMQEGKGVIMRLEGVIAPPIGTSDKSGKYDAGLAAKSHLEEVIQRHGVDSLGIVVEKLDSGEDVVTLRSANDENISRRMLRDGYATPSHDGKNMARREMLTKQAENNNRGIWYKNEFPEVDKTWRRESKMPDMTWKDKRARVARNTTQAMCTTPTQVANMLSRPETKIFSLNVGMWANDGRIDEEIEKQTNRNPQRMVDVYDRNMEILEDLRKRKDDLTPADKQAHDRLTLGSRALGGVLVERNLLDEKKFIKGKHPYLTRNGIELSKKGLRSVADATADLVDKGADEVRKRIPGMRRSADWYLGEISG